MAHESPKRIRNVALVGHRGSGKTSVNEALLFTAGAINRLGSVADGTTVSDSAPDEKAREMSISASLSSFRWDGPQDQPDRHARRAQLRGRRPLRAARLRGRGVRGQRRDGRRGHHQPALAARLRARPGAHPVREHARPRARRLLPQRSTRSRQAFGQHVVATEIPIGSEHELEGVIDLIDMKAYRYDGDGRENCSEIPIPDELADRAQEMREKLMDEVAEVSDELMERYLEGEEISHEETVDALKTGVTEGHLFPVTCGAATRNLGINRLLDAFVEDLPSPAKRGDDRRSTACTLEPDEAKDDGRVRLQDARRPLRRAAEPVPRLPGRARATTRTCTTAAPTSRSASASCSCRRARTPSTPTSSAPATSAPWPSSRRPTPATCSGGQGRGDPARAARRCRAP